MSPSIVPSQSHARTFSSILSHPSYIMLRLDQTKMVGTSLLDLWTESTCLGRNGMQELQCRDMEEHLRLSTTELFIFPISPMGGCIRLMGRRRKAMVIRCQLLLVRVHHSLRNFALKYFQISESFPPICRFRCESSTTSFHSLHPGRPHGRPIRTRCVNNPRRHRHSR